MAGRHGGSGGVHSTTRQSGRRNKGRDGRGSYSIKRKSRHADRYGWDLADHLAWSARVRKGDDA